MFPEGTVVSYKYIIIVSLFFEEIELQDKTS